MPERTCSCAHCGATFTTSHPRKIYCRRKCASDAMNAKHNIPAPRLQKSCPHCGDVFVGLRRDRSYCSVKCGRSARANRRTRASGTCVSCGGEFFGRADKVYCSSRCNARHKAGVPPVRQCGECKADISEMTARRRYCPPCARMREAARRRKVIRRLRRPVQRERVCLACGTRFTAASNRARYCSNRCGEHHRRTGRTSRRAERKCITCASAIPPSAPLNQRYCGSNCRPAKRPPGRTTTAPRSLRVRTAMCGYCRSEFTTARTNQKYCSEWCSDSGTNCRSAATAYDRRLGRTCERCGTAIPKTDRVNKRFCSETCQVCFNQELRRARKRGLPSERISRAEIFARDNYICHICMEPIDDKPVLDHLIPLALSDSPGHVRENVAAAHAYCNGAKNARVRPEDYDLYIRLSLGGSVCV